MSDMARRLSVFAWVGVDHDVLKALYQSVIEPETRHRLGEYYTPDGLAHRIVETVVAEPLTSRVLDPACGSGTFLFHAVRKFLEAAKLGGHRQFAERTAFDSVEHHTGKLPASEFPVVLERRRSQVTTAMAFVLGHARPYAPGAAWLFLSV